MSPLASLLSRGKEEQDEALGVPDLPAQRLTVIARVNLLPPEIGEAARFRREQFVRAGAVAAAVAVVAVLAVSASSGVSDAQAGVDAANARADQLRVETAALAIVPQTAQALTTAETQRYGALGQEVKWSTYLTDFGLVMPADTQITSMQVTQVDGAAGAAGAAGATATAPTAANGAVIGTATYAGVAKTNEDIAFFLDALADQPANVNPYFSSATSSKDPQTKRDSVNFGATVSITSDAESKRYTSGG